MPRITFWLAVCAGACPLAFSQDLPLSLGLAELRASGGTVSGGNTSLSVAGPSIGIEGALGINWHVALTADYARSGFGSGNSGLQEVMGGTRITGPSLHHLRPYAELSLGIVKFTNVTQVTPVPSIKAPDPPKGKGGGDGGSGSGGSSTTVTIPTPPVTVSTGSGPSVSSGGQATTVSTGGSASSTSGSQQTTPSTSGSNQAVPQTTPNPSPSATNPVAIAPPQTISTAETKFAIAPGAGVSYALGRYLGIFVDVRFVKPMGEATYVRTAFGVAVRFGAIGR